MGQQCGDGQTFMINRIDGSSLFVFSTST